MESTSQPRECLKIRRLRQPFSKALPVVWWRGIQFSRNKFGACSDQCRGMAALFRRQGILSSRELRTVISKRIEQTRAKRFGRWMFKEALWRGPGLLKGKGNKILGVFFEGVGGWRGVRG